METMTTKEAMEAANFSRSHWQRLKRAGKLPKPIKRIGRNWIYDAYEVRLLAYERGSLAEMPVRK